MKRFLLIGSICCFCLSVFAQDNKQDDPVLMRVNGKDISRSEFEYSYRRHVANANERLPSKEQSTKEVSSKELSPKEYAELFALSKLKVQAAETAGLDTTAAFRNEHEANRAKLLTTCLTDNQAMDSAARLLYQKKASNGRGGCQVQVMQIFKYLPQTITSRHLEETKTKMDSLYQAAVNLPDSDFSRLVEQYSDDKRSRWIECLQTTPDFENVAFSLSKGETSQPFFTPEGIYILRVIDRKELLPYEELREQLMGQLNSTEQLNSTGFYKPNKLPASATETIVEQLKKDWQYTPNQPAINELLTKGTTDQTLFTIKGQPYSGTTFRLFALSHPQAVKRQLSGFIAKSLLDYESRNLELHHPEVRYALRASDDAYLIAEITRQKVDLPAMNDRAGLATYFQFHTSDYRWEQPRYKGAILHCTDKKTAKQARKMLKKMLKKVPQKEWADKLRQTFNTLGAEKIQIELGIFADGDNQYIDKLVFKHGDFEPLLSYPFTVVAGKKIKAPEDYREVIDRVRSDYRTYLDACWTRDLRQSGKVEINQEVLKTVNNN